MGDYLLKQEGTSPSLYILKRSDKDVRKQIIHIQGYVL